MFPLRAECRVGPHGRRCDGRANDTVCCGTVRFEQINEETCRIKWDLTGCGAPGLHGFHIHEKADFSDGCKSAGPHYNPHGKSHGGPNDGERHVGDLGNITVDADGNSRGEMEDRLVKLFGETSVMGRSVMVHEQEDDLGRGSDEGSRTTGNAGARIACGKIVSTTVRKRLNLIRIMLRLTSL